MYVDNCRHTPNLSGLCAAAPAGNGGQNAPLQIFYHLLGYPCWPKSHKPPGDVFTGTDGDFKNAPSPY